MTRKELKQYRKIVKQYRKKLIKIASDWAPYDYYDMLQLLYVSLKGIREYYDKGLNVWTMERKDWDDPNIPTRKEICEMLISRFDQYTEEDDTSKLNEFFDLLKEYIGALWD